MLYLVSMFYYIFEIYVAYASLQSFDPRGHLQKAIFDY